MSGGITALRGFDYQATVILDLLFDCFEKYKNNVTIRPEGEDDLDICISDINSNKQEFFQIKKPRENKYGVPSHQPWTLTDAIEHLFPNAIRNLLNTDSIQHWVVGDTFAQEIESLIISRENAPFHEPFLYWDTVCRLGRKQILCDKKDRKKINKIRIKSIDALFQNPIQYLVDSFDSEVKKRDLDKNVVDLYRKEIVEIHSKLPNILGRIILYPTFGKEEDVVNRVNSRLKKQYKISEEISRKMLFRNLRGFINDISKQYNKTFNLEDFESELAYVWPRIIHVCEPPPKPPIFIPRPEIIKQFLYHQQSKAIEIVGISGSGKSLFASEALDYIQTFHTKSLAFYSEVRTGEDVSLRDILCGLAFTLRRYGVTEPFSIAIEHTLSEEYVLQRLADTLNKIELRVTLFIDFVSGVCSDQFARDLASFLRSNHKTTFQLVLLGQERSLRFFTQLEQDTLNIVQYFIPGFTKTEFIKLTQAFNPDIDVSLVCEMYDKLSAGRDSGLQAALANLVASRSINEMKKITQLSREKIIPAAEKLRFSVLPDNVRNAAGKLACFMLPFTKEDATGAFPDLDMGMAISFLLDKGLLQPIQEEFFEMHEVIRKGILSLISPIGMVDSHYKLALWYEDKPIAKIYHLLQAGEKEKANELAYKEFFCGSWHSLIDYVCDNSLLTIDDVYSSIKNKTYPKSCPLDSLLRRLGVGDPFPVLLSLVHEDQDYFNSDINWSMNIGRSITKHSIEHFLMLLTITIEYAKKHPENEHTTLDWANLLIERDSKFELPENYLELLKKENSTIKRRLIPLLLLDKRREIIKFVIEMESKEPKGKAFSRKSDIAFPLHINSVKDAVEFLASISDTSVGQMIATRSSLEGWIGDYVWCNKEILSSYCKEILKYHDDHEILVQKNALRVLIHTSDMNAIKLAQPFIKEGHPLHGFAVLLPVFFPGQINIEANKNLLFNVDMKMIDRLTPLMLLAAAGEDINILYSKLKSLEAESRYQEIDFAFSQMSIQQHCEVALPFYEKMLESHDWLPSIIIPHLVMMSESSSADSLKILMKALSHESHEIRATAAMVLSQRRDSKALSRILECLSSETNEVVVVNLVVAAISSGISSISETIGFPQNETVLPWKCKLIGRLHDTSPASASLLISTACDTKKHWEVRRAAILAASHLPFEVALKHIYSDVLKEQSSLLADTSSDLIAHSHLRDILLNEGGGLLMTYERGKETFIDFWSGIFNECWSDSIFTYDIPTGESIAVWLYDKLHHLDFPNNYRVLNEIISELCIPVLHDTVLRALALTHQYELLEKALAKSPNIWTAIRAVIARIKAGNYDETAKERVINIVNSSPYKNACHGIIFNVISGPILTKPWQTEKKEYLPSFPVYRFDCSDELSKIKSMVSGKTLVVRAQSADDLQTLLCRIDKNMEEKRNIKRVPQLKINNDKETIIKHTTTSTYNSSDTDLRDKVIPCISARFTAFGVIPDWHIEKMESPYSHLYILEYAHCLAVLENKNFFYEQLESNEKILLCVIENYLFFISQPELITERIIPLISRYINAGTPKLFEGICALTCQIKTNSVDRLLSSLVRRWAKEKTSIPYAQNDLSINLARAFKQLSAHPRFFKVTDWLRLITAVLQSGVRWYEKQELLQILGKHPNTYSLLEMQLLHITVDRHNLWDEIDQLDEDAQKYFKQVVC